VIWYCDASTVVKRYVRETGSLWFRRECGKHRLVIGHPTIVEVNAAFALKHRVGSISVFDLYTHVRAFRRHVKQNQYLVLPVTEPIIKLASHLVLNHVLRGYDAIQLATALDYVKTRGLPRSQFCFLTADHQLYRAAGAEGLATDNPNHH